MGLVIVSPANPPPANHGGGLLVTRNREGARMLLSARAKHEFVRQWADRAEEVRAYLENDGANAVCRLMADGRSLRSIAREIGCSPTYLSLVKSGDSVISPTRYMQLLRLEMKCKAASG